MPLKLKFILFQAAIILPFIAGYFSRKFINNTQIAAKKIIRIIFYQLEPLIVLWSIWGLTLSFDQAFLPLSGLAIVAAGFFDRNVYCSIYKP